MTDDQITRSLALSNSLKAVMDAEPDYLVLSAVMAAHIQRMICDEAQNRPEEAGSLAEKFHAHYLGKINFITEIAYP